MKLNPNIRLKIKIIYIHIREDVNTFDEKFKDRHRVK